MNQRMRSDLILSCKSKTNNPIKRKTKGHVFLFVVDLFCLMFYFGFVFYYGCDSRSLSDHNGDDSENNFDRIDVQKKGGKILRLGVINFIVRHIQQKTNFTQTTVNKRTKRLGFVFRVAVAVLRSSVTVLQGACCVPGLGTRRDWSGLKGNANVLPITDSLGPFGASNKNLGAASQTLLTAIKSRLRRRLPLGILRSNDATATRTSLKK